MGVKLFSKDFCSRKKPFTTSKEARKVLSNLNWDEAVLERVEHFLSDLMKRSPVEVYAVALDLLRYPRKTLPETIVQGVEDIARSAARHSLRGPPLGDWTPKMKVKSDDYTQLINYHRQCTLRVLKFVATGDLIKRTGTEWIWHNPRCEACPPTSKVPVVALGIPKHPTSWWVIFWERVVASIGECPCEELLEDGQIWNSTLQALAKECPTCYQTAVEKYPRFKEKVMQIITDIIDSVELEIIR